MRGQIQPRAAIAVLDFDDPKIGIEADLPFQPPLGLACVEPIRLVLSSEEAINAWGQINRLGLRRWAIDGGFAIHSVDLYEDRSGLRSAAPP